MQSVQTNEQKQTAGEGEKEMSTRKKGEGDLKGL